MVQRFGFIARKSGSLGVANYYLDVFAVDRETAIKIANDNKLEIMGDGREWTNDMSGINLHQEFNSKDISTKKPFHFHDCEKCIYIKTIIMGSDWSKLKSKEIYDLYFCPKQTPHPTLIARYGPEGEYVSGGFASFSVEEHHMREARVEGIRKRLFTNCQAFRWWHTDWVGDRK